MSSFDYLKTAIRQKGCTLQQVADASGMTKGYLSQLLNAKIKSPSAQKLEALHRFLNLEFPRQQKNIGVVFGEVGLAGEIRPVPSGQERISEAAKHGFRRAIVPAANVPKKVPEGMQVFGVKKLADALSVFDDL